MRAIPLFVLMSISAGCHADSLHLEYQSTLWSETRGLAYLGDGQRLAHAAMWDTTCQIDPVSGLVTGDVDLPTEAEVVADGANGVIWARSSLGVHRVRGLTWNSSEDLAMEGVSDVGVSLQGTVLLDQACRVTWLGLDVDQTLPACAEGALHADPGAIAVLAVADRQAHLVTPDGVISLGSADLAARDAASGIWLLARGATLSALDETGGVRWTYEAPAPILSLDGLGGWGGAAIVDAHRELTLIGPDGARVGRTRLPAHAEVVTDKASTSLALVLPDQVNFYDVQDGPQRLGSVDTSQVEQAFSD